VVLLLSAAPGHAQAPVPIHVVGKTHCPNPEAVATALSRLLPHRFIDSAQGDSAQGPLGITVQLSEADTRYSVVVGGTERRLEDPTRSCQDRAQAAAVFAALVLEPPALPAAIPTAPPPPPHRSRVRVELEALGQLDVAPRTDGSLITGGGGVRWIVGGRWLKGTIGVSGLSPATVELGVAQVRITRVPVDLGLRATYRRGRFELTGELGLELAAVILEGLAVPAAEHGTRLEVGGRATLGARIWFRDRVAPFVAFAVAFFPRPHDLVVEPLGIVGATPYVWLGPQLGLAVRLH